MCSALIDSIVRELRHASLAAALFVVIAPHIGAQSGAPAGVRTTASAPATSPPPPAAPLDAPSERECGRGIEGDERPAPF